MPLCPRCHSSNVRAVTVSRETGGVKTSTENKIKGFGWCKGCVMACIVGPWGWLCGLCGMGKGKSRTVVKDTRRVHDEVQYCCLDCGLQFKES